MGLEEYNQDVFITTEDLAASRHPHQQNFLNEFLENTSLLRFLGIAYTLIAFVALIQFDFAHEWLNGLLGLEKANLTDSLGIATFVTLPFYIFVFGSGLYEQYNKGILFIRNVRFLSQVIQVFFLMVVIWLLYFVALNLQQNIPPELQINFNFISGDFGVEVSEGPDYNSDNWIIDKIPVINSIKEIAPGTYGRGILVGLVNTIRIVIIGIIISTAVGIFVGIGLLSNNWLVRKVSAVYVEFFRNTPLLVQLVFLGGLGAVLPAESSNALELPGGFYLSTQGGLSYPIPVFRETFLFFIVLLPFTLGIAWGLRRWRLRLQDATGKPANVLRWILLPFLIVLVLNVVIGLILEGQLPFAIEVPRLDDNPLPSLRKFEGGGRFTFAFLVVLLGLVFYTSAFIADIVRAGILSVPKGQIEAARAAGLNSPQTLRLVVLPQAMRLIVPPLTNQYLNLSKNSSLGLAVGFWDLFNVTRIIDNNTGQSIAVFIIIMLTYLMLSLIISFIMNSFNQSLRLKTR